MARRFTTTRCKHAGDPGSRAPHVWLEHEGRRCSSLDLLGSSFVLLAAPHGAAWCRAAQPFAGLMSYCVGRDLADPAGRFAAACDLSSTGAVLIRPDGFVGWRARTIAHDPSSALADAMGTLLMKAHAPGFVQVTDESLPWTDPGWLPVRR